MSSEYSASDKMLLKSHDRRQIVTFIFLITTVLFWTANNPVFAAMSLTFTGLPPNINQDEEISVQVSLTGAPLNTTYYLRAAFYVDATTQYFGYTWNNSGWNNIPSDYKNFLQINTGSSGEFNGALKTKVDLSSNYFKGTGEYQFKLGRYTEGGSGPSWSDSLVTTITGPTPTPVPTVTPVPTNTPTPLPSPSNTPTPSPKPTSTPKPTAIPTSQPTITENSTPTDEDLPDIDLSINNAMESTPTIEPEVLGTNSAKISKPGLPVILIIAGTLLTLAGGGLLAYQEMKKNVA